MGVPSEDLAHRASSTDGDRVLFHATAIAVDEKGVLILGQSGAGKSSLALSLMALGAALISDDGVWLEAGLLTRPDTAPPWIEARGIGLLHAGSMCAQARLSLVVDLSRPEVDRLPMPRVAQIGVQKAPLILAQGQTTLAPKILQLLRHGRADVTL